MNAFKFCLLAAACVWQASAHADDSVRYRVTINANWTAVGHPKDYPANAHFSGLIGAVHSGKYVIFKDGGRATDGLEALSEKGAHSPLDQEIRAAIARGDAYQLFESGPLFKFPGTLTTEFSATPAHPYVSLVAMVAPSPDWFTGVSRLNLREGANWVASKTVTIYAWDAGTDDGATYMSPDRDAMPRTPIRLRASAHFLAGSGLVPVGTVTFTRIDGRASAN